MQGGKFWRLREAWFGIRDRRAWLSALVPPFQTFLWGLAYKPFRIKYPIPAMKLIVDGLVPPLQKLLWGLAYNQLTTKMPTPALTFLNLGYIGGEMIVRDPIAKSWLGHGVIATALPLVLAVTVTALGWMRARPRTAAPS